MTAMLMKFCIFSNFSFCNLILLKNSCLDVRFVVFTFAVLSSRNKSILHFFYYFVPIQIIKYFSNNLRLHLSIDIFLELFNDFLSPSLSILTRCHFLILILQSSRHFLKIESRASF